jgi:hypothetical protein
VPDPVEQRPYALTVDHNQPALSVPHGTGAT